MINPGPAAGGAGWTFKAPTGTVLVSDAEYDGPWCYFLDESGRPAKELPEVGCSTEGEFPAAASGYLGVKGKMKLRIISTPGDNGTLRVRPPCWSYRATMVRTASSTTAITRSGVTVHPGTTSLGGAWPRDAAGIDRRHCNGSAPMSR